MFGIGKSKKPSTNQDNGSVIQGFVCPSCLSHFNSSHELEVHFQTAHDSPRVEDDETVLLRQQVTAAEQTRELMQNEITRQAQSIAKLEETLTEMAKSKTQLENSLQLKTTENEKIEQELLNEKKLKQEAFETTWNLNSKLQEIQKDISTKADSSKEVEQLETKLQNSLQSLTLAKEEIKKTALVQAEEVAKLHENLVKVKGTYDSFISSLVKLISNVNSFEETGFEVEKSVSMSDLSPACGSLATVLSEQFKSHSKERQSLLQSIADHEKQLEMLSKENQTLQQHLSMLEEVQKRNKTKLADLASFVNVHCDDINDSEHESVHLLNAIQEEFASFKTKNEQLSSEIERNVSDEDVLKRIRQDYEKTLERKATEVASLQADLDAKHLYISELQPTVASLEEQVANLNSECSSSSSEVCLFPCTMTSFS